MMIHTDLSNKIFIIKKFRKCMKQTNKSIKITFLKIKTDPHILKIQLPYNPNLKTRLEFTYIFTTQ